jgi:hypothetical protein
MQNKLTQNTETVGQWYSDTSPLNSSWIEEQNIFTGVLHALPKKGNSF